MSSQDKSAAPNGTKRLPYYEPFAWWLARERIGKDLRERYAAPNDLPACMRVLIKKLDDHRAD